jgi:DNA primase catalytic subunit
MKKRKFPLRYSTLEEREKFYRDEFDINKVKEWFKKKRGVLPQLCALDAGSESGIILDKKLKNSMLYFPFSELKKKVIEYIPEDVYYDRNIYKNPNQILKTLNFRNTKYLSQDLIFDVDADNIPCDLCKHKDKFKVCSKCIHKSYINAVKIKEHLQKKFKRIILIYSGRGFHVQVFDSKAFTLSVREREDFNRQFEKYAIDPWVSRGYIRLIRMPYSLNGLVSRKVTPLTNSKFYEDKTIPNFLKD